MIKSMTGYGNATYENKDCKIAVEVKTLNSKFLDLSLKLPKGAQEYELDLKALVSDILVRGKAGITLDYEEKQKDEARFNLNPSLFQQYFEQLRELRGTLKVSDETIFENALQMPEVLQQKEAKETLKISLDELLATMKKALLACDEFRVREGKVLHEKFLSYVSAIQEKLNAVDKRDPERTVAIKERIEKNLAEMIGKDKVDQNRFEQELIYYIEKLDISEEKVRLASHLNFFKEALGSPESNGKKLSFISQEIGREINTIGSKANDAVIQRLVVEMKEELEKIKEQLLNIL